MQFYRQASNMTNMRWAPLQGAVVIHEKGWNQIRRHSKTKCSGSRAKVGADLRESNREQEERSLNAMKSRGLEIVEVTEDDLNGWRDVAARAYPKVRGDLVPAEIFDRVESLRDEYREQQANQP